MLSCLVKPSARAIGYCSLSFEGRYAAGREFEISGCPMQRLLHLILIVLAAVASRVTASPAQAQAPSGKDVIFQGPTTKWQGPSVDWSHGRLRVNSGNRYLEHADGTPFRWVGDSVWDLTNKITLAQAGLLMEDRRAKGYTVIQFAALGVYYGRNTNGDEPFMGRDFSQPNPAYFDHLDDLVELARSKGLAALLAVLWCHSGGSTSALRIFDFSQGQAADFAAFISDRYKDSVNVMLSISGDYDPSPDETMQSKINAMGAAAASAGPELLITAHPGSSSSSHFQAQTWKKFAMTQSGHMLRSDRAAISLMATSWAAEPMKPTINGESAYENHPIGFNKNNGYFESADVRRHLYYSFMSGGFGITYGNHAIWAFSPPWPISDENNVPLVPDWTLSLGAPVGNQMRHVRSLLDARPLGGTPDQTIVANNLSSGSTIVCKRTAQSAMCYVPDAVITEINTHKVSGDYIKVWLMSPRTGMVKYVGIFENRGTHAITMPTFEGPMQDWILLIDDASVNFPVPGTS